MPPVIITVQFLLCHWVAEIIIRVVFPRVIMSG